jgi:hypothetical protein
MSGSVDGQPCIHQHDASRARQRRDCQELIDRFGNPGIVTINGVSAGGASLALQGSPGGQYALQATTDFQTWTNLLTTPNLPPTYLDSDAPGFLYRFYRLRWQ